MESVIELQRQTHEELERFQSALVSLLVEKPPAHKENLTLQHSASKLLDRIEGRAQALTAQYMDESARQTEIEYLSAPLKPDDLSQFYSRLVKIRDHHRKYPDSVADGFEIELRGILEPRINIGADNEPEEEDPISLLFSGEEGYGRYLDLHVHHTAYNNLKHIRKRLPYLQYLDILSIAIKGTLHSELPIETRSTQQFDLYINALRSYLTSFLHRTRPLENIVHILNTAESDFKATWEAGKVEDWEEAKLRSIKTQNEEGIWCSACQKLYSKQTVYDAHLKSRKHVKATERLATAVTPTHLSNPNGPETDSPSKTASTSNSKFYSIASQVHSCKVLLSTVESILLDTKGNVERRFALTARERELEQTEPQPNEPTAAVIAAEEEEEEEEKIYNPLKLPLGWDGKPIPYWLYKLHGLGVEYRCEICSDHVYMGRKNFERHFQESRHAFGMRALGLPNTKHFHEITRIEDALSLAEKLKQEGRKEVAQVETTEELEDDEGNVYSRKTYDDLKKQGII